MVTAYPIDCIPACHHLGTLQLTAQDKAPVDLLKVHLMTHGGYIERHAICTSPLYPGMTSLSYVVSDYAAIKTLRKAGATIAAIGSGTLLCCPERQTLLLQRRAAFIDTYPNRLAAFGGHFTPDRHGETLGPLMDTLIAEIQEESGIDLQALGLIAPEYLPPLYMIVEPDTGAIQFTPIAFALTPAQMDQATGSEEGALETFHLKADIDLLTDEQQWSQMGYACFRTWQASGYAVQKNWTGPRMG